MKRTKHPLTALLLVVSASITAYSQTKTMEPEKAIEQTIAAGETHSYSMTLAAGTYGVVDLDQKGINLTLTIFSTEGQKLRIADLTGVGFAEEISFVAQGTTTYRVEVNAGAQPVVKGSYALKLSQIHAATDDDRLRVQALAASKEIDDLTTDYEQLQTRIRQSSPRYAALVEPAPLSGRPLLGRFHDPGRVALNPCF